MIPLKSVKKLIHLSVITTGLCLLNNLGASAVTIGLFNNITYTFPLESDNLINTLEMFGHQVTQFDSLDASVWQTVTEQNQVLVIPDVIRQTLAPDLSPQTQAVIRNYVNNGGGFLIFGEVLEAIPIYNDVFGWNLEEDFWAGSTLLNTENATETIFENGPSSLPNTAFTTTMSLSSLPFGSISFYDNLFNSPANEQNSTSIFVSSFGLGKVAYNGFSYSDLPNALGWPDATNNTVEFIAGNITTSTPEPSVTLGLFVIGGLGILSLRIRRF